MLKILYIHHATGWGGPTNSLIQLINALDKSIFEPEVLLLKNTDLLSKFSENNISCRVINSFFYNRIYKFFPHSEAGYVHWYQVLTFIKLSIIWLFSRYYFSRVTLKDIEADIIHLNSSVLTDWIANSSKKAKVVMHIREPFRKGRFDLLHYFFRGQMKKYADGLIAISNDNEKRINLPSKTKTVYNFAQVPAILPAPDSYSSNKVLYLGGTSTSKGFYTMVKAMNYIDKSVTVYFCGHNYDIVKFRKISQIFKFLFSLTIKRNLAIIKLKKYPNAHLVGLVTKPERLFSETCCLLSPFIVPHFSRPVIESHLFRKPAIGSDVEGMSEIINHDVNGLLVPVNNPKELANAVNFITSNPKIAKQYGEMGFKLAINKFTGDNVKQIEKMYIDCIK